ncbi:hypothetical protein OJF2_64370 [Aquisphaera giovannonii]|uniref:O-antigen ligase-related domain-containing protein n=1 Tax=Aquisphaera giovannonii TaxID=406548 RepID=A0A5B9WCQ5_9BACT|nr:O-antigen ligase family protein [Aquisphaera giovannonii]QEH37845.1 hypothetical protein OJF2_64370 [Aquisphaera giovannonii]
MQFAWFVSLTAILLLRPADIIPLLQGLPLYQVVILVCVALSFGGIFRQLRARSLLENPISFCIVGLLAAVFLSHLSHFRFMSAVESGDFFLRICLFYFLLVAVIDSPKKFRRYLVALNVLIVILVAVALLQYHGAISIPELEAYHQREVDDESGEELFFERLCGPGIFNDPNDLCLVLAFGVMISLHLRDTSPSRLTGLFGLSPTPLLIYALAMTHSRGGLLTLGAGLLGYYGSRLGLKRAMPVLVVAGTLVLPLLSGRQTDISLSGGTGHDRVGLWREGMALFWYNPIFGIGMNEYVEEVGLVAHNSFVHGFVELGFFGGTCFVTIFAFSLQSLSALRGDKNLPTHRHLDGARNLLTASLFAFGMGFMSLSRVYFVPTYLLFGLITSYFNIIRGRASYRPPGINQSTLRGYGKISLCVLFGFYIFIKLSPR